MTSKSSVKRNSSQANRLPAPSLFIGPPSRNASDTSIIPPTSAAGTGSKTPGARGNPLSRQRSQRTEAAADGAGNGATAMNRSNSSSGAAGPGVSWKDAPPPLQSPLLHQANISTMDQAAHHHHHQGQHDQPSTDAIWAEMQNTLEEVELSATTGTHVFRPGHSQALDELRTAQIALAQAWARSEAEEEDRTMTEQDELLRNNGLHGSRPLSAANVLQMDREQKLMGGSVGPAAAVAAAMGAGGAAGVAGGATASAVAGGTRPRSGTETSAKSQLERDTENDIQLARKRREANDRYFQRVNAGVLDVVAKLEEVAKAMKGVEQESKEIWGDAESVDTASVVSK
ncbi:uncharacterized protein LTHEOB_1260 [Lasiodiplodia theobromae]|uniref:Uncharacterized protein n=1 Tax=Lasiodiplodia theobromae TaxID=45133 RepID=A0A5N5DBL7_9PEZI|nr:uncharacterized protein LTHEOB_1260 [Lasiodiplodia theobromae]KAB2575129.1 hypothetical protein DBV05_g6233 [Lasiodiplodia theobromae]KAF4538906.1 hypothetical protein LTHEOB_1260 [Lasiodiplodia theobromae]